MNWSDDNSLAKEVKNDLTDSLILCRFRSSRYVTEGLTRYEEQERVGPMATR